MIKYSGSKHLKYTIMKYETMRKFTLIAMVLGMLMAQCRTVTVQQAANGKAKCGKWLR